MGLGLLIPGGSSGPRPGLSTNSVKFQVKMENGSQRIGIVIADEGGSDARRYELTAEQWRRIEGILPGKSGDRDRTATDKRTFVNGVMWVLRSGALWKHLPEQYGRWKSVYTRFLRWEKAGIWEKIFAVLMQDPRNQYAIIDSMLVRAHQQSEARRESNKTRLWGVPEVD